MFELNGIHSAVIGTMNVNRFVVEMMLQESNAGVVELVDTLS